MFTKFASSLIGQTGRVGLTGPSVGWEVELVVVRAKTTSRVTTADAWDHVAGFRGARTSAIVKSRCAGNRRNSRCRRVFRALARPVRLW
ncbi:MAG TPA: fumarylacetoacetate hydrolase family protein [Amycolatopsis sp.]|nr:fumarylacetoacetate hydrolase family protein [Amycolatopsis sp.]